MEQIKFYPRKPNAKFGIVIVYLCIIVSLSFLIIDSILTHRFLGFILTPLFLILPAIIYFVFRKTIFGVFQINEIGIALAYKHQVIKEMKWQEMKNLQILGSSIIFSKTDNRFRGLHSLNISSDHMALCLRKLPKDFYEELAKHLPQLSFNIDDKTLDYIKKNVA